MLLRLSVRLALALAITALGLAPLPLAGVPAQDVGRGWAWVGPEAARALRPARSEREPLKTAFAQATYPLMVVDDTGASTTFAGPPQRIVSLSPGYTEDVFALGAGDRLVAVDSYSDYPPEAAAVETRLTTYPSPSVEALVALQPDLVLSLVEKDDVVAQLRQQGIPVLRLLPADFDATVQVILTLGQVLDVADRAEAIAADMRARRDAVAQTVADAPAPSVFYEMDASDPIRPFAAGPRGFYGQLVELAGGRNIFADIPGDFGQVSAESVIARNPDLIILADAYSPYNPQTPALVSLRPGWDAITAVRDGAIYAVDADILSRPSPRLVEGLETLAYLFHPDRFAAAGGPRLAAPGSASPFCQAGQAPEFAYGFQALAELLGGAMGEATECAHVDPANGDTYQQTTKGLAIYRRATNTPTFSSGGEQWALTADGLTQVSGGQEPPGSP